MDTITIQATIEINTDKDSTMITDLIRNDSKYFLQQFDTTISEIKIQSVKLSDGLTFKRQE